MKRLFAVVLALCMVFAVAACGEDAGKKDLTNAKSLADLAGAKIPAQSGTFHADAVSQIKDVVSSTYPDFTDLLVALKSGAIDGYIAEEPTALSVCEKESTLTYIPLVNNDTGFTATDADVGIAVGYQTGSELVAKTNDILATISTETRMKLMEQMVDLTNQKEIGELALQYEVKEATNGKFIVGMECGYEPFNWTQTDDKNGAVPISGKNGMYANGYDVQIAKYIANELGMELEIAQYEFDSLVPGVQSGALTAIIAGMSPTAEREEQVDFTDTYYNSNLVVIIRK